MAARLRRRRRPLGSPRGRAARSRPVRDARLPHRGGVVPRHPGRERAPRRPGIRRHAGHQRPARPRALRTDRARRRRRHPAARARGGTNRRGDRDRHRLRRPRRGALPGLRRALERRGSARERGRELRGRGAVSTRGAAHHLRLRPAPAITRATTPPLPDPLAAVHSGLRRAGRQRGDELVPARERAGGQLEPGGAGDDARPARVRGPPAGERPSALHRPGRAPTTGVPLLARTLVPAPQGRRARRARALPPRQRSAHARPDVHALPALRRPRGRRGRPARSRHALSTRVSP